MIAADKDVDARYEFLRTRHGEKNAMANGYRLSGFFRREQRALFSVLEPDNGPFLDAACGSGLMLQPLIAQGKTVYGLDFNKDACTAARQNGIQILRGDAFNMPLKDSSIGQITNCQFLNQQPPEQTEKFILEARRVLKPGGQLILLWRHAASLLHITAHTIFTGIDKITGQPPFPQYKHPLEEIRAFASKAGLTMEKEGVTLPFLKPDIIDEKNPAARIIGASLFATLRKP